MRIFVNGVDVSSVWQLQLFDEHLWCSLSGWAEETGVHLYEAPTLNALMLCTETECTPFPLSVSEPLARMEREKWWVRWDAFASALHGRWEQRGGEVHLFLPTVPLHLPLKLGDGVPEMLFWQGNSVPRRLSDWAGKPFVLLFAAQQRLENLHDRLFLVATTLDISAVPEGVLADPFALGWQLFGGAPMVGITGDLKWATTFHCVEEALAWLASIPPSNPTFAPSLLTVTLAWLETKRAPTSAEAWLALAEAQRLYCGLEAAVASYERACAFGSPWARWRLGVVWWLQGEPDAAQRVWKEGPLPEVVRALALLS